MNENIDINKKITTGVPQEPIETPLPERMTDGDPDIEKKEEAFYRAMGIVYYDEEGNRIETPDDEKGNNIYDDTQ